MFTENLDIFFNNDELGDSHVFEGSPIIAIVEDVEYDPMEPSRTFANGKVLHCKESDITLPVPTQAVTLDGDVYDTISVRRESGVAVITLNREES